MFFNFNYFRKQFLFGKKINVRKNTFFAKIFYFFKKGVCFTNSFLFAKKPIKNKRSQGRVVIYGKLDLPIFDNKLFTKSVFPTF